MDEPDLLAEVRAVREAMARRHAGDVGSLLRELAERQKKGGRRTVRLAPRRPDPDEPVAAPVGALPSLAVAQPG